MKNQATGFSLSLSSLIPATNHNLPITRSRDARWHPPPLVLFASSLRSPRRSLVREHAAQTRPFFAAGALSRLIVCQSPKKGSRKARTVT